MAVNNTEPRFEAPIPGMSMTHELGARPWQTPPKYATVEEALEYYLPRMQDNSFTDSLINVIEMGMPLTTLANTIQLAGVMEGRHSIDVGVLILPVIMEMIMLIADAEGIKYETGMERDKEAEVKDSRIMAGMARARKELSDDIPEKDEEILEVQEELAEMPKGLMGRR